MNEKSNRYREDKKTIISILKYALLILIILLVLYLGGKLIWILLPVLLGFVIAYTSTLISKGLYRLFMRRQPRTLENGRDTKGYKALKLVVYFIMLLTFIGFLILVILALIAQFRNLLSYIESNANSFDVIAEFSTYLENVSARLGGILPESAITRITSELAKIQDDLLDQIPSLTSKALTGLLGFVGSFPDVIFKIIVVIMAGYYFISDRILIGKFVNEVFPSKSFVDKVTGSVKKVSSSLFRVLGGYLVIMLVTFIEALIGLTIIGMPYAVILAIAVMFIDLLPMVGASATFVPISIYMFIQGKPLQGIIALVFVGLMTFVRSVMEPKIIGTAIRLHPLATLASMLIGISFFGFVGFLGGPILVIFLTGISEAFGFQRIFKDWLGNILNKVAGEGRTDASENKRIRHIVMWKLKESPSKKELADEMTAKLRSLPGLIPEILFLDCGPDSAIDQGAYDYVLIVDFKDENDLKAYKEHPEHVKIASWISENTTQRSVVDL